MSGADFVVIPVYVYAELLKFCTAAQQGTDAPGIKPEAIQVILDALEENKGTTYVSVNTFGSSPWEKQGCIISQ